MSMNHLGLPVPVPVGVKLPARLPRGPTLPSSRVCASASAPARLFSIAISSNVSTCRTSGVHSPCDLSQMMPAAERAPTRAGAVTRLAARRSSWTAAPSPPALPGGGQSSHAAPLRLSGAPDSAFGDGIETVVSYCLEGEASEELPKVTEGSRPGEPAPPSCCRNDVKDKARVRPDSRLASTRGSRALSMGPAASGSPSEGSVWPAWPPPLLDGDRGIAGLDENWGTCIPLEPPLEPPAAADGDPDGEGTAEAPASPRSRTSCCLIVSIRSRRPPASAIFSLWLRGPPAGLDGQAALSSASVRLAERSMSSSILSPSGARPSGKIWFSSGLRALPRELLEAVGSAQKLHRTRGKVMGQGERK